MSTEHLTTGSVNPPITKGKLRLYSMRFCPYAQRVHLVLDAKEIPHDVVFIDLSVKPDWYIKLIPTAKVPALVVNDINIYESTIISEFLDEQYPTIPLHSTDPIEKAKDRLLVEAFSKVASAVYRLYHLETADKDHFEEFLALIEPFEKELQQRGKYFGGNSVGLVDFMIWPWFERFPLLPIIFSPEFTIPEAKFPNIIKWQKLMLEDKAVKRNYLTPEQHAYYLKTRKAGKPDYQIKALL